MLHLLIAEINNTQVDDTQGIDIVMPIYNLIEHINAFSKISWSFSQYYRDEPALDNYNNIVDFPAKYNNSTSLKLKEQITGQTGKGVTKDVEIMVRLKYVSNFWITLETPLLIVKIVFSWNGLKIVF